MSRVAKRTMERQAAEPIPMVPSSGNVFADLGLLDAVALDIKLRLAMEINLLIEAQQFTPAGAAKRLHASPTSISALRRYKLDGLSVAHLLRFLLALGQDVAIRVCPRRATRAAARIIVSRVGAETGRRARTHA